MSTVKEILMLALVARVGAATTANSSRARVPPFACTK
jgi:hypothetical protein